MKKYDSYKDTEIDFIGKIPDNWEFYNLKFILRDGVKDGPHETPIWYEDGIPFLSIDGIVDGEISFNNCRYIDEEQYQKFSKKLVIEKDDIFIGKAASIGKIARVKTDRKFTVWSPIAVIKVKNEFSPTFVEYYFRSDIIQHQIELFSTSNTQKNIAMGDIPKMKFIAPSFDEQTQIANYLDHKTSKIDDLISKKEQLIELLKEERTAIINQAVTKGLDPNVPMKDSGIEWLGQIPEGWEVKKIKYVASLKSGNSIISEQIKDTGEYPVYGGNGVRGYFTEYTNDGDFILIGRQGALCGNIKFVSDRFWASEHAIVCYLQPEYNWIWFGKLLESMNLNQYNQSAAQPGLAVGAIKNLSIPSPEIEEQSQIVDFVLNYEKKTDEIIKKYFQEIELLKEYKTVLISEVVTGKVDVRDVVLN
jgi:type I restriction enzyme, S subunit